MNKLLLFLVILQILENTIKVEAKKGKGKAFGAGILAGGLAGAAVGHILTRQNTPTEVHHHHHIVDPNAANPNPSVNATPPPKPSVIIERGETLANGCYKEIVKEPDSHDFTKFIETERLICPQNVPVTIVHPAPIQHPVIPAMPVESVPAPAHHSPAIDVNPNPQTHDNPTRPQPVPLVPVVTHQQPVVIQPVHPLSPVVPGSTGPSQIIVLSKKTGSYEDNKNKKNSGNRIMVINLGFMSIIIGLMGVF
ncbi:uncharacterized protein ACRADG_009011 [Cochliomyia hominivorax]